MESGTFLNDEIQNEFKRFVEIRIHTDHDKPELRRAGKMLQSKRFKTLAVPYYVVLDPTGTKVYWTGAGVLSEEVFLEGLRKAPQDQEAAR